MESGTINELVNTRSIIKHIRKHNKDLIQGAGVGNDYSLANDVVSTEAVADTPYIAWIKALNNLAVSGTKPSGVRIIMLLPENVEETDIKSYMKDFNNFADENSIQILGGHTQVSRAYSYPSFVVTVYGRRNTEDNYVIVESKNYSDLKYKKVKYLPDIKKIDCKCKIYMVGYAGLMGTDILARKKYDELRNRFSRSYIEGAYFNPKEYYVNDNVERLLELKKEDVLYIHDVSHGGIYGALWQLGCKINKGIKILHSNIPIKQETVEVAEYFNINPYMLDGTGAFVAVIKDDKEKSKNKLRIDDTSIVDFEDIDDIERDFARVGVIARYIGDIIEGNSKMVSLGDEENPEMRFLEPIKNDEIYKILDRLNVN